MKKLITVIAWGLVTVLGRATPITITDGNGHVVTITPISEYPNDPAPSNGVLFVIAHPGGTNFNVSKLQLFQLLSTDPLVRSNLQASGGLNGTNGMNGTNGLPGAAGAPGTNAPIVTSGQVFLTTQTNLLFDFATAQNYQVFSTYTNTAVPVTLSLTNIVMPTNGFQSLTIVLRNLATNNLHYVLPDGINWTTNYPANTNLPSAGFQLIQLLCEPTSGTNNSIIGY
jgi:hypothetical protein